MGLPIAIALTAGEVSDYKGYMPVMDAEGPAPKVLLADKGYDANFIRDDMERRGGFAMIPTKKNRLVQIPVDGAIYALRNIIERCFNKLKNARLPRPHVITRPPTLLSSSMSSHFFLWIKTVFVKVLIRRALIYILKDLVGAGGLTYDPQIRSAALPPGYAPPCEGRMAPAVQGQPRVYTTPARLV